MKQAGNLSKIQKLKSIQHLFISLVFSVVAFFISSSLPVNFLAKLMLAWVIFCLTHTGISWYLFSKTDTKQIREQANLEDETKAGISLLVLLSTFAGLTAVFLLLAKTNIASSFHWLSITLAILGMFLSWFLVHTIFTVRYAHLYYGSQSDDKGNYPKGLKFPTDEEPDFMDFAYYSLVIGMTFQVSDVNITSKQMRKLTLLHSVISFIFNTCIVALTINAIASFIN